MTDTVNESTACARAGRDGALGCNPKQLIELLNDDDAREIYLFLEDPATVSDIADELDLPQSTAYRKVENLHDAGLISQLNEHSRSGVPSHYVQAIDHVTVTYDDPLRIECVRNGMTLYCEP
ncbi:helix-turn-helix domain-containing protein [Halopiger aswanensis]|uniref:Helix-turn-helix protein n=1 Tax=Halopiger aswanensis TaxID=148449 RepID=A0A3R7DXA0_9EURY|nr:helix-turn-helix domain-containing protein [Halopiger aswanensis]RKD89159.1 helix-turn-helix protein [Halopiger aswanensis]